jgi:hypothetical protein
MSSPFVASERQHMRGVQVKVRIRRRKSAKARADAVKAWINGHVHAFAIYGKG